VLERGAHVDEPRTIVGVRTLAFREQFRQAWKFAPEIRVVDVDDVVAQLRDRHARPVGLGLRTVVERVEHDDDDPGVEPALAARVLERSAAATAIVDPELLEEPRARRTLRDELADAALGEAPAYSRDVSEYDITLFFHLLGAFALIAGTVLAGVAFEAARRRRLASEIALLLGLTRVGVVLVGVGTLLVLAFGLRLVDLGHWGFGAGWIVATFVLLGLTIVLGAVGGQRPKRARKLAARLRDEDAAGTRELRALLDDRLALAANYVSALLLLAIVVLMVFKPGS